MRDQLLRGRFPVRHHERGDQLAPLAVRDADHRDLPDRRVRHQRVLDLDGGDVLAAGDDHVLLPVGDHEVALLVEVADHVLALRHADGVLRTHHLVGRHLGLSAGNVRVIRHRGIDKLRRCVDAGGRAA